MDLVSWRWLVPLTALAVPGTLGLVALFAPRHARAGTAAALLLASGLLVGAALTAGSPLPDLGVRVDAVTCVMLALVAGLGVIVARYAGAYLAGDPGFEVHARWLLVTLGAVTSLVVADDLLVVGLGWTATSFAVHRLLTLYGTRRVAVVAAHKKFLVSRVADACLLGCFALIHHEVGSLAFDDLDAWVALHPTLTPGVEAAAVLIVMAVALRSAQLPFHGWLTQVMEAPTPVSALLHAGVVNVGGFVLIRLAPLMNQAEAARSVLLAVGLTSALLAALVMTTRSSVKVGLAWSTCAQMGFMLVQCGLGAWHLALLHLVAHSLYKAHAFLSAGSAVDAWRERSSGRAGAASPLRLGLASVATVGIALLLLVGSHPVAPSSPSSWIPVLTLGVGLGLASAPLALRAPARALGVLALYVGCHAAASDLASVAAAAPNPVAWAVAGLGLVALFGVKTALTLRPEGRLRHALHPWLFSGFYLDDVFTRFAFRIWPPRLPEMHPAAPSGVPTTIEAQA